MQKNWTNQNVNIQTLMERITKYLEGEDFDVTVYNGERGYIIIANNSSKYEIEGDITIQIQGEPNQFSIKIEEKRGKSWEDRIPPLLATMFGGGYLFLKKLKSEERFIEFTVEFWRNVNKILNELKI
jgi:type IV secretory pathway ATPase VirB11/archaellum biosynthesis ATPase